MNHSRTLNNHSMDCIKEQKRKVTIHHRNLKTRAYEIFKGNKNMALEILTEIFPQKESNYSLRNSTALQGRSIKTVMYGSETRPGLGPKIWDGIKKDYVFYIIPKEIGEWAPENCSCRLCKTYVQNIGFV